MKEIIKDKNNKTSSKRVLGIICMSIGLLMAIGVTVIYLIATLKGNQIEIEQLRIVFSSVFAAGTTLLGVGVFEKNKNE